MIFTKNLKQGVSCGACHEKIIINNPSAKLISLEEVAAVRMQLDGQDLIAALISAIIGAVGGYLMAYINFRVSFEARLAKIEHELSLLKPFRDVLLKEGSNRVNEIVDIMRDGEDHEPHESE